MMGAGGMMGTPPPAARAGADASPASLDAMRGRVERWLAANGYAGFRVAEIMAFDNNDCAAIRDAHGAPAFELVAARGVDWLMQEPASMMWDTRYGMMRGTTGPGSRQGGGMMGGGGGGYGAGGRVALPVSAAEAVQVADRWLSQARPGERAEPDAQAYPGYFTLDTTRSGSTAGMVSVNASTGGVWYRSWHGRFLNERTW